MDNNPYATSGEVGLYTEPERTSIAAVMSLICSLICCIPAVPLLGVVLGALAMIGIGRSDGRVGGKGLAVGGIVLGLLFTAAQIGLVMGGGALAKMYTGMVGNLAGTALTDLQNDQFDGTRGIFANALSSASDEDLAAFRDAYTADLGNFVSTPQTIGELFSGFAAQGQLMQGYQGRNDLMPVPANFDNGAGLVLIVIDQTGSSPPAAGTEFPIVDLYVIGPDGTSYELGSYVSMSALDTPAPEDAPTDDPSAEDPDGP